MCLSSDPEETLQLEFLLEVDDAWSAELYKAVADPAARVNAPTARLYQPVGVLHVPLLETGPGRPATAVLASGPGLAGSVGLLRAWLSRGRGRGLFVWCCETWSALCGVWAGIREAVADAEARGRLEDGSFEVRFQVTCPLLACADSSRELLLDPRKRSRWRRPDDSDRAHAWLTRDECLVLAPLEDEEFGLVPLLASFAQDSGFTACATGPSSFVTAVRRAAQRAGSVEVVAEKW